MPVTDMERLTVLCLHADTTPLLTALSALTAVEILPANIADEQDNPLPPLATDSATASAAAARIEGLLPEFFARNHRRAARRRTPIAVDEQEFSRSGARERAMKTADEAERLLACIQETNEKIAAEQAEMAALLPYLSHPFPLDDAGTKATGFLLGALPAGIATADLEKAALTAGFVYEILTADKTGVYIAVIAHRAMQADALSALETLGFIPAAWRDNHGRATALFDAAGARAAALKDELARANAQLDSLSDNLTDMKILSDILHSEAELARYREKMQATEACALLTAWCPAHEKARVSALLDGLDAAYTFTPAAPGEKAPVLAITPPVQGRLAPVLNAYSYPRVQGKSAALPLQILFFLFFGFLFADAGYGLLTALLFLPIARFLCVETRTKHAFYTLACCGLGAIPFGVLAGNYFGNWLTALSGKITLVPFPAVANTFAKWRRIFASPRGFLSVSLALAGVVLLVILIIRTVCLCRAGKPFDGVLSALPELFTFTGLGLTVFYPLIGLAITAVGLMMTALIHVRTVAGGKAKRIAYGGALLTLLTKLFEVLQAARIALIGTALIPVAHLISRLPLARGEALVWYAGMLLTFAITHLLCTLLTYTVTALRRARLAYLARHDAYYPARERLLQPMRLTRKYTVALPVYPAADEPSEEMEADNAPVPFTTQKL